MEWRFAGTQNHRCCREKATRSLHSYARGGSWEKLRAMLGDSRGVVFSLLPFPPKEGETAPLLSLATQSWLQVVSHTNTQGMSNRC